MLVAFNRLFLDSWRAPAAAAARARTHATPLRVARRRRRQVNFKTLADQLGGVTHADQLFVDAMMGESVETWRAFAGLRAVLGMMLHGRADLYLQACVSTLDLLHDALAQLVAVVNTRMQWMVRVRLVQPRPPAAACCSRRSGWLRAAQCGRCR